MDNLAKENVVFKNKMEEKVYREKLSIKMIKTCTKLKKETSIKIKDLSRTSKKLEQENNFSEHIIIKTLNIQNKTEY